MIQVNRIYLIFNRLVTKKFLVDTSDYTYIAYLFHQINTIGQRQMPHTVLIDYFFQFFYLLYHTGFCFR